MAATDYPLPIITSPARPLLPPQPATITVPVDGTVVVRHYWGDSARRELGRLWITTPVYQEVTSGDRSEVWPGDNTYLTNLVAGTEIRVAINGNTTNNSSTGVPNTGPTFTNLGENARVHAITDFPRDVVPWARYIEWEDLVINSGANNHYNDCRTLIYYPSEGWVTGAATFG